ncbi:hypothetical protein DEO72_LG7g604 [Vigna unguiculata]|uniref:Uncharacterized protein n=1 Tax=Vigna unguiculata TaxID=3917 RepID=A0A4D6MEW2_VIGUN|nr:hypothetical protein DEO72_LG7g604 [Vigna unguiculata]
MSVFDKVVKLLKSSLELPPPAVGSQGLVLAISNCERMSMLVWTGVCNCCRKTVVRPDNLAQASQSRLGEMDRGSPRPFLREGSLKRPTQFLSERASRSSEERLA